MVTRAPCANSMRRSLRSQHGPERRLGRRAGAALSRSAPAVVEGRAIERRGRRRIPVGSRSVHAGNTWRKRSREHSCGRTAAASREPPPAIPGQQARSAIGHRIGNAPAAAGLGRGRNPGRGLHHRDDHARGGATSGPRAHRERCPQDRFAAGAIVPDLARADRIAILQAASR